MTQEKSFQKKELQEGEIDIVSLVKKVLAERKKIMKSMLVFMLIGVLIAVFSEKEFTSSTTVVPQSVDGSQMSGGIGGLAAMAGISLGGLGLDTGIPPTLYPEIVESIPFQKGLLKIPLTFEGYDKKMTFEEYYTKEYKQSVMGFVKKYTLGLPGEIVKMIRGKKVDPVYEDLNQIESVTLKQDELIKKMEKLVEFDVNDEEGFLTISGAMPEALAAAELTQGAMELLQQYIINFKVQKSKDQLSFIKERYLEKEEQFKALQMQLAEFRDRNQNVNSSKAQVQLEVLEAEFDLVYGVYLELAKKLEAQEIQVKEDTPVFTVLSPVTVSIKKTKPKRILIVVLWIFLGALFGIAKVFGSDYLLFLKEELTDLPKETKDTTKE